MSKWYIRDRGRVIGPFGTEQLLEMREAGQVQGYVEVSPDRRLWKALDLVPELGGRPGGGRQEGTRGGRREVEEPTSPGPEPVAQADRSKFLLVVGGVVALVFVGGLAIGGALILRPRPGDAGGGNAQAGPVVGGGGWVGGGGGGGNGGGDAGAGAASKGTDGAIHFSPRTLLKERDQILADSVGLVVAGAIIKFSDGAKTESLFFGTGSGFAITPDGHLVTNRHVVEDLVNFNDSADRREIERKARITVDPKIWVFFGHDQKTEAEVIHFSVDYDLAILKINKPTSRYFALCHAEDAQIPKFDLVSSLGFPGTDRKANRILNPNSPVEVPKGAPIQRAFQDADFNLTKENGGIKKPAQKARPDPKLREAYFLVHTARIAGGNSGGPLITPDGTVLGINSLGIVTKVGGLEINQEGQNYAMTMLQLRKEIDKHAPGVVWRDLPE